MKLETTIIINAPIQTVWTIFSDFKKYPEWNPFVHSLNGAVEVGEQIEITLPQMNFKPRVLKYNHQDELRWRGKLGVKGIFDGEHYFQMEAMGDDQTKFIHGEHFSGLLMPFMIRQLNGSIKDGFIEMNEAFKKRSEEFYRNESA